MKKQERIEQLEKRVKDLEFFASMVFKGLIGMRQYLVKSINEAPAKETPDDSQGK